MNLLIIPARMGSTRFPGKPLAEIAGVPMVVRVWERVRQASGFGRVVVAHDDDAIEDVCNQWLVPQIFTDRACRNGTERCHDVTEYLRECSESAVVVNIQGDEPLMDQVIAQRLLFNVQAQPERVWTAVRRAKLHEMSDRDVVKCWVVGGSVVGWSRDGVEGYEWVQVGCYGYTVGRLREYMTKEPTVDEVSMGLEQVRWGEPLACFTTEYDGIGVDRPEHIPMVEERLRRDAADRR